MKMYPYPHTLLLKHTHTQSPTHHENGNPHTNCTESSTVDFFFLQIWWNVDLSKGLRNGYGEEPIISALEKKKYNGYDNDMW